MRTFASLVAAVLGIVSLAWPQPLVGQTPEAETVNAASQTLTEIMAIPNRRIPETLLSEAEGIAIIPDLLKGGFVVGVRYGRGIVVVRDENRAWKPPAFVSLTGGSVGWQIGVQATDLILVFVTKNSVDGLMRGKFTIGADVAAAAGPIGRQATAATDARLKAEIYSYSRSRGLFAGVSLDGSALQIDNTANAIYYRGQPSPLPTSATRLLEQLARYTGAPASLPNLAPGPEDGSTPQTLTPVDVQAMRRQLATSSRQLYAILDENWKRYLALPAEVFSDSGNALPNAQALGQSLNRFEAIVSNPQYQTLVQRPEFQATHQLLKKYFQVLTRQTSGVLTLPPPPVAARPGDFR